MSTQLFEQHIIDLNFSLLDSEKKKSGVLLTDSFERLNVEAVSPNILFALETAKSKFHADAVFFRYFQDGRGFIPQLYLFDYTNKSLTNEERNRVHIQMWNGYQVPAYILIEKSSVSIFDSRKRPKENKDSYTKEIVIITGEAIKDYNAKEFDNGIFWDEQNENNFRFEESATKDLIRGLKGIFRSFIEESELDRHVALKLLVQSLLIKYLEERDEKSASGYFAGTYFKKNFQCSNFCDTIRNGKLLDLLDQLAKDFNGKIFEWDKETEEGIEERNAIQNAEVQNLADYLDGNIKDSQYVIWRLYSFTHLPVEVISSVYEELLTDSKDIVYTPEMIVSTLVDECMPIKNPQNDFKVIDVSCGSGIFLVKTYKRIVQWWRYDEWKKTGKLIKPSLPVLKKLLLKSIHGVDIEPDAIRLSVFSLALAILDEVDLDPPTWGKLKFPDLSKNIITQDFFEFITNKPNTNFDLVIGNPPFNLPEVNGKEPSRKQYFRELNDRVGYESEISIPDENPALHFLVQSLKLLKQNGLLCLIEPSGPLLYQKDLSFKQDLFTKSNLLQVIDFTKLADKLWGRKNVATVGVFIQKSVPDDKDVLHLVANRTFTNNNRLFLEFDHYDFHLVSKNELINSHYIWKSNLMGGGRLSQLIERLSKIPTLGQYLKEKRKNDGWVYGDGFIKGKPDIELIDSDFEKKKGGYSEARHLTNKLCFEPEDFNEEGIHRTFINNDKYYQWPRVETIFKPPLLLIKKNIGKESIPVVFCNLPITYKNEIIGIHAPNEDADSLKELEGTLRNNKLFRFYLALTSSRAGVSRSKSTLLQKDIFNLPFLGDLNISEADQLIINDIIEYQLSGSKLSDNSTKTNISNFSEIFCKTLNSIYKEEKSFQLFKIIDTGKYFALHFEYTSKEIISQIEMAPDLEVYIEMVTPSNDKKTESFHIQKIIKVYGQDSIILAKPKQLRYWLPSIALRDADETFADYFKSRHSNA
ncbi:HsdM family class I SAM-dependent methyltransferase [Leeuwenhoekiella marinoflava]|uniref:site-specific DNA-methyltransferase (adenine-specific) n=2 Tax=Leeuwenhoekiella marinoflava TaxID=988 RepID=A0A4V1KSC9_9FLAO|nr:N-6 DNA methylase [Leeuwenhoekiella marinoflava]RXG29910.1 N-6 DNA methylase [Leeuwenhoekiella marinoflava]SHF26584.1 N-6 DNA Methylase [Leeuwenhoekiella marinoflava DSM 3653]